MIAISKISHSYILRDVVAQFASRNFCAAAAVAMPAVTVGHVFSRMFLK